MKSLAEKKYFLKSETTSTEIEEFLSPLFVYHLQKQQTTSLKQTNKNLRLGKGRIEANFEVSIFKHQYFGKRNIVVIWTN